MEPGTYGDGGRGSNGLALLVKRSIHGHVTKSWIQRIRIGARETNIGLGAYPLVALTEARGKAFDNRRTVAARGGDPRTPRQVVPTVEQAMIETIAALQPTWQNGASERQWKSDLRLYIGPALGSARIDKVTTADCIRLIEPIWTEKRPTAERLRYRLSIIMQRAIGKGYRTDDPAGAQLIGSLPKARREVAHMEAVPHSEVPAAVRKIRESRKHWAIPAVVEFVILTGVRSGEATGATWQEIDFESRTWIVPGARMKVRKPHTVPLSDRAIEILETARAQGNGSPLIFPSARGGKEMKSQVIVRFIKSLGIDATIHGFRSSFRDWCSDNGIVREVAEAALAHTVKGVEGAYARSDLLERRRPTMEAWSRHVAG